MPGGGLCMLATDLSRALDPVLFAQDCGLTPDPWQADLLRSTAPRVLELCARQTGTAKEPPGLSVFHTEGSSERNRTVQPLRGAASSDSASQTSVIAAEWAANIADGLPSAAAVPATRRAPAGRSHQCRGAEPLSRPGRA